MRVRLALFLALAALLVASAGASLAACSSSGSTAVSPTTGIVVRAEALTTGRGCGRGPTNLYRYAVVVFGYQSGPTELPASYGSPVTANVFDCFTDGAFIELPPVAGNSSFRLEVFAYNELAYTASRGVIEGAGTNTAALLTTAPTWTTECTATQQQDVQSLALCAPLGAGLTGLGGTAPVTRITLATDTFQLPDGRTATCATGGDAGVRDAAVDAADAQKPQDSGLLDGAADAADARADAAPPPAPTPAPLGPVVFTAVRVRYRVGTAIGPTRDLACPQPFVVDVPAEPARYDLDVGLLDRAGSPLGQLACSATTQSGTTSPAVCP